MVISNPTTPLTPMTGVSSLLKSAIVITLTTSVVAYISYQHGKKKNQRSNKKSKRKHTKADLSRGNVGPRGLDALAPPIPYLDKFLQCLDDPCDAQENRNGRIALCVAENKLVIDLVANRCASSSTNAFLDHSVYLYNNFLGMPVIREAAAYFLARRFLFPHRGNKTTTTNTTSIQPLPPLTPDEALRHIKPQHIAMGS
jgi:hypothetical protein